MPRFAVEAAGPFEDDLDIAVSWRLREAGPTSAGNLLDAYDACITALESFPYHGASVEGTPYRWCPLDRFIAVYNVDEPTRTVTLMRLFQMGANWKSRLLHGEAEN